MIKYMEKVFHWVLSKTGVSYVMYIQGRSLQMGVIYYWCVEFYSIIYIEESLNDCYVLEWVIDGAELMLLLLLPVFFFLRWNFPFMSEEM